MTTTYAIGDIHGHLDLLQRAHERIEADRARHGTAQAPVIHLGDLVDRGPDSPGVIDLLRLGIGAGQPWVVLKGNHDRGFSIFLDSPTARDAAMRAEFSWLHPRIGGAETLEAYGVRAPADRPIAHVNADAVAAVPPEHRAFMAALPAHAERGATLFVHAGIRPSVPLPQQTETDLIWIREPFLSHRDPHPWLVIHGHTAVDAPEHRGNRVNLDSGAAYGGLLTAAVVEGTEVFVLTDRGRLRLAPV